MHAFSVLALFAGLTLGHGPHEDSHTSSEMGPAAFMWPEDRPWSADADNTPPCGSSSGVGERTEFPMSKSAPAILKKSISSEKPSYLCRKLVYTTVYSDNKDTPKGSAEQCSNSAQRTETVGITIRETVTISETFKLQHVGDGQIWESLFQQVSP